jgi:hypothetical protein
MPRHPILLRIRLRSANASVGAVAARGWELSRLAVLRSQAAKAVASAKKRVSIHGNKQKAFAEVFGTLQKKYNMSPVEVWKQSGGGGGGGGGFAGFGSDPASIAANTLPSAGSMGGPPMGSMSATPQKPASSLFGAAATPSPGSQSLFGGGAVASPPQFGSPAAIGSFGAAPTQVSWSHHPIMLCVRGLSWWLPPP